jgi:hypothetical protein
LTIALPSKSFLTVVLVGKLAHRRFLIVVQLSGLPSMIIPAVIFLNFFGYHSITFTAKIIKRGKSWKCWKKVN